LFRYDLSEEKITSLSLSLEQKNELKQLSLIQIIDFIENKSEEQVDRQTRDSLISQITLTGKETDYINSLEP
jgi:hypothetical protein